MAHKILVVDDEPNILRLMEFILAQQGHEMLVAVNGEEALQKIQTHRPDLVLLDIMMPRIDGYEVARLLRADTSTTALPIIMLSAKAQEEDIRRGMEIGVNEYITKPFSPEHLVHRVADCLHRAQQNRKISQEDLAGKSEGVQDDAGVRTRDGSSATDD